MHILTMLIQFYKLVIEKSVLKDIIFIFYLISRVLSNRLFLSTKSQLKSFIKYHLAIQQRITLEEIARYLFKTWLIRIYICKDFIDLRVNGTSGQIFAWANTAESRPKWINLVPICNIDWQSSKIIM